MANESPLDLDTMIAEGEIEGDKVAARKRLDIAARDREFEYALLHDFAMMIQIARAAARAAVRESAIQEETRTALASSDPDEVTRMQKLVSHRAWQRAAALAEAATLAF